MQRQAETAGYHEFQDDPDAMLVRVLCAPFMTWRHETKCAELPCFSCLQHPFCKSEMPPSNTQCLPACCGRPIHI